MKKYERLDINERVNLEKLKNNELFKKKNGTINIRKIAKQMNRDYRTIWQELNMFDNIGDYNAAKAQKIHDKNKKQCRKYSMLNSQELSHFSNEYNNFGRSPQNIIMSYELQYNVKFSVCFKTMYKYIRLGYFNLSKNNLYFKNKKRKTKNGEKNDNRGVLLNIRDYKQFLNDYGDDLSFSGIWEMDTLDCGNFHLLVLVNRKSKIVFYDILFTKKASIVLMVLMKMVRQIGINKFSCILTDRGKEFYKWKLIEKYLKIRVYFCDPGKPKQKALVERINRDIRRWFLRNEPIINIRSRLKSVLDILNTTIRPCLGDFTSKQYFKKIFVH
ncbi:IS30 family transposase [Spiroplasma endosymbiont of Sarcophaga variegata]|uniref:IS30 family transposase n=1 Tax=Spiroplasma endosymbiont of Sarcophaga variegata TaxID=3066304 RepID=UPI003AF65E4C